MIYQHETSPQNSSIHNGFARAVEFLGSWAHRHIGHRKRNASLDIKIIFVYHLPFLCVVNIFKRIIFSFKYDNK